MLHNQQTQSPPPNFWAFHRTRRRPSRGALWTTLRLTGTDPVLSKPEEHWLAQAAKQFAWHQANYEGWRASSQVSIPSEGGAVAWPGARGSFQIPLGLLVEARQGPRARPAQPAGRAADARHDPTPDQVPREKLDRLKQVLVWIYGSKADDMEPVVRTQNPDIKRLGEVLANAEGRHVLEQGRSLDEAHASTESADKRFTASLLRARDDIRDAAGSLRAYDGRDQSLLDIAEDVNETAEVVHSRMAKKRREARTAE